MAKAFAARTPTIAFAHSAVMQEPKVWCCNGPASADDASTTVIKPKAAFFMMQFLAMIPRRQRAIKSKVACRNGISASRRATADVHGLAQT
jgi:hypothetical protein